MNAMQRVHHPLSFGPSLDRMWIRCKVLLLALAMGSGAAELKDFAGTWVLDTAGSDRIEAAIETCIAKYPEDAKTTTRERLQETNQLTGSLVFSALDSGKKVLIGYATADNGTVAPVDGKTVPSTGASGELFQLSVRLENGALIETFQADNGKRTNTYTVSAQGKTLIVRVAVESPYMPTILTYRLVYVREVTSVKNPGRKARYGKDRTEGYGLDGRFLAGRSARRLPTVERAR